MGNATNTVWGVYKAAGPVIRYMARHWNGENSLAVAFWRNTLLVGLLFNEFIKVVGKFIILPMPPGLAFSMTVYVGFMVLLHAWQLVGLWRSAERHVERGGKPFLAKAAKVAVVIGWHVVLLTAVGFYILFTETVYRLLVVA